MPVKAQCSNPACGKVLTVPDKYAGREGKCPGCGRPVRFPTLAGSGPAALPAQPPAGKPVSFPVDTQRMRTTVVQAERDEEDPDALAGWEWSLLLAGLSCGALILMGGLLPWHAAIGFVEFPAGLGVGCFAAFLGFLLLVRSRFSPGLLLVALVLALTAWIALLPRLRPRLVPAEPVVARATRHLPLTFVQAGSENPASEGRRKLDVAFVVETSEAMAGRWPALQAEIVRAAEELRRQDPQAGIGLITFRTNLVKKTKVLAEELPVGDALIPFTRDAVDFARLVGNLRAEGGGDTPESSFDALYLASQQPWRAKADKVLVLITDAPPRVPDSNMRNLDEAMRELKRREIRQVHVMTDSYHYTNFYKGLHKEFTGQQFELRGAGVDFNKILTKVGTEIAQLSLKQRGLTTRTIKHKMISVDILFALDLTGSMQREIDGVRSGINVFARELLARRIDARIGLIGYRDQKEDAPSKVFEVLRFPQKPYRLEEPETTTSTDIVENAGTADSLLSPERLQAALAKVVPGGAAPEQAALDALARAARLPFRKDAAKVVVLIAEGKPAIPDKEVLGPWHLAEVFHDRGIRFVNLVVPAERLPAYRPLLAATTGNHALPGAALTWDWMPAAPPVSSPPPSSGAPPESVAPGEASPAPAVGMVLAKPGIGLWAAFLGMSGMVGCFLVLGLCRPLDLGRSPRFGDLPRVLQLFAPFVGSLLAGAVAGLFWIAAVRAS